MHGESCIVDPDVTHGNYQLRMGILLSRLNENPHNHIAWCTQMMFELFRVTYTR